MRVKKNNFTENEISKALKIYNYFIENSFSNFEEKKLSKLSFKILLKFVSCSSSISPTISSTKS